MRHAYAPAGPRCIWLVHCVGAWLTRHVNVIRAPERGRRQVGQLALRTVIEPTANVVVLVHIEAVLTGDVLT